MHITIIDCGSSKVPDIEKMIGDLGAVTTTIQLSGKIPECDGIVISGAPVLLTETSADPYLKQTEFILKTDKPVLGICFGHQLIGLHHHARI